MTNQISLIVSSPFEDTVPAVSTSIGILGVGTWKEKPRRFLKSKVLRLQCYKAQVWNIILISGPGKSSFFHLTTLRAARIVYDQAFSGP